MTQPAGARGEPRKWEVLNFGIDQYLLPWEQFAGKPRPQYVAMFVAMLHMERTVDRYERGAFATISGENLWIRPTFGIENGASVRFAARDVEPLRKGNGV